ncbi:MAG: VOC family protein [Sporichthyaceae bacterium]|jgi:predicted 3-demethylubiquinone-9 3-methyltransferase (glyoxalase superfamily)
MRPITPCLWFDGNAEQAAAFYVSVFPNSSIDNVAKAPDGGTPSNEPGDVMVVEFTLNGQPYVGLNGGPLFTFSEAISFQIHCTDQAEVDHFWDALVDGGEPGPCGWLKDRFGLSWQVVPTRVIELMADPTTGQAAFAAINRVAKPNIAEVEAACAQVA